MKKGIVLLLVCIAIGGCFIYTNNNSKLEEEQVVEVSKDYYICGKYYTETLDYITNNILNLYNPPNEKVYMESFNNIASMMTEACKNSYMRQLGSYVEGSTKSITIDKVDVGFREWQNDNNDKIFVRLLIANGNEKEYLTTEFKIDTNNKIYTYEMW